MYAYLPADDINNQPEIEMAPNQRVTRVVVRVYHVSRYSQLLLSYLGAINEISSDKKRIIFHNMILILSIRRKLISMKGPS